MRRLDGRIVAGFFSGPDNSLMQEPTQWARPQQGAMNGGEQLHGWVPASDVRTFVG